jgi:hypothetical protein
VGNRLLTSRPMIIDARTLPTPVDDWFREHYPKNCHVHKEKAGELAAYCRHKKQRSLNTRFFEANVPIQETEDYWQSLAAYFASLPPDAVIVFP